MPEARDHGVVGARQAGDRVEQDDHVALVLDQALGALDHHVGDLHMARGRFVEGGADDFGGAHAAHHLGHFFRAFVDQQDDQVHFRMVVHDGLGDVLQHHGLAGLGRRHDDAALALADRRDQVEDAAADVFRGTVAAFEAERLAREQRGQVLEQDLVLGSFRRLAVDVVDLEQREVAFPVFWRADASGDVVAGAQVEAADLAGADT